MMKQQFLKPSRHAKDLFVWGLQTALKRNDSIRGSDWSEKSGWKKDVLATRDRICVLIDQLLENRPARLLEIGPGPGVLALIAKEKLHIDVDVCELDFVLERGDSPFLNDLGVPVHTAYMPWNLGHVPKRAYDLTIFSQVIAHVRYPHMSVIQDLLETIKLDGRVLLTTVNVGNVHNVRRVLRGEGITPELPTELGSGHITDEWPHIKEYGAQELANLIRRAGGLISNGFFFENTVSQYPTAFHRIFYHTTYCLKPSLCENTGLIFGRNDGALT